MAKTMTARTEEEAVKKVTEKRRVPSTAGNNGFSPIIADNGIHTKPGDNSRYALALLDMCKDDPILSQAFEGVDGSIESLLPLRSVIVDRNDILTMSKRVLGYLAWCVANDERITNLVMYMRIGINKDIAWQWKTEKSRGEKHREFIESVLGICSAAREMLGADGKLNPATLIWWQKNYDGYTDNQTITLVNGGNALDVDGQSKDDIAKKYLEQIPKNIPIDTDGKEIETE